MTAACKGSASRLPRPLALLAAALLAAAVARPVPAMDVNRPEVREFIADMSARYSYDKRRLRKLLKKAQSQPAILEAMDRPAERSKAWFEYREIFVNEKRIGEGVEFWREHRAALERASARTGVPPEYLVAILGVETRYGRSTGRYRVLDALATLAFDYPPRSKFFTEELEQFLLLGREGTVKPLTTLGSYAGAMGAPQFMPSNYRRYAVDAAANGRIDLWSNWDDVLASIGNYFRQFGWTPGEAVLTEAVLVTPTPAPVADPELAPAPAPAPAPVADPAADANPAAAPALDGHRLELSETVGSLRSKGLVFESTLPADAPALAIAADEPDGAHWRVGYRNFYVITRYNHSALYGMAVYELAAAIRERMGLQDAVVGAPIP